MPKASKTDISRVALPENLLDELRLGPNTSLFLRRMYASGLDKYLHRLERLGFPGGARALDAGCGLGQWSFALTQICDEVYGTDNSPDRVDACRKISDALEIGNAHFLTGVLEQLPFPDGFFDRILCYSVLNLTHYERSVEELSRVTRSGGLVYLSSNDMGRYVYDIVKRPNPAADFDPREFGLKTLWNTLAGIRRGFSPSRGAVVTGKNRTLRLLERCGFRIVDSGPEGRLNGGTEPFLLGHFWGMVCTFDVLAQKI